MFLGFDLDARGNDSAGAQAKSKIGKIGFSR
jgi:hypothetical protein